MISPEFTPLEPEVCSECKRVWGAWYDLRDRDITEQFKAGVTVPRIARGYRLSDRRVMEIIRDRLGMELMLRIGRTNRENETESEEEE